jgi:hypothetical protein
MSDDDVPRQAEPLARYIGRVLNGKGPMVQAAVLADLTATWLRGHRTNDAEATQTLRAEILALHCIAVRKLVILADEESS